MEPPASPTPGTERVFYRDLEEFNKALDAAADSIRNSGRPDIIGHVVWWGLVAALAVLLVADWGFRWEVRSTLLPGVDLVKPVGLAIVGLLIYHHVQTRNRHGRILRDRLCLKCGTPLARVRVDEHGDGACPACARRFNLGEYRRPGESRGRDFHGYLDRKHFEKALFAAAEQIRRTRGLGLETDAMGWAWVALGVVFFVRLLLDVDLFDWVPGGLPYVGIWFVAMLLWGGWYTYRIGRLKPSIIARRRCMNCGFCLLHTGVDEQELGRCPECGTPFALAQYAAPPDPGDERSAKR